MKGELKERLINLEMSQALGCSHSGLVPLAPSGSIVLRGAQRSPVAEDWTVRDEGGEWEQRGSSKSRGGCTVSAPSTAVKQLRTIKTTWGFGSDA